MKLFPTVAFAFIVATGQAQDLPTDKLKALFPAAASFKASKKTVAEAKRADIEALLGAKLADAELAQQFYIATKAEGGPAGLAYFGKVSDVEFGVGVTYEGARVAAVKIFAPANSPLADEKFLKQFDGKTVSSTKPPAPEQKALADFLRAQYDNMSAMDVPQQSALRKVKAAKEPLADEPAAIAKGIVEYEKLVVGNATVLGDKAAKYNEMAKESIAAANAFAEAAKASPSDFPKLDAAYKTLNDACEKCHSDNQSATAKQRREIVPPRGASDFKIGPEISAPAGQDAAAQAFATEVKKAVALAKSLYNLK